MAVPVQVGQIIGGKYEVERVLAQGGVGVVVKARHVRLLDPCAIKFMLPEALETPMARERFVREARACARLKSDHVVKVFDVGELDPRTPYMVLEYLEGVDLETRMEGGPLSLGEASLYILQVCAALAEAHALGIIHRDIKPGNVFLARREDGTTRVKLLDFGISKLLGETGPADQARTMEGTVMGTPSFMSPEQARGEGVDARTDIWAVGVVLYHLVTGLFPFDDSSPFKTLDRILLDDPRPPSHYLATLPAEIDQIVLRCLEKDPARRPAGVDEIAAALAPFADEGGTPISLHVRRVFESLVDGRLSTPPPVAMGETPKPPAQPVAMGETPKPPTEPVAMGETPKPPTEPVAMAETPKPPAQPSTPEAVPVAVPIAIRSPSRSRIAAATLGLVVLAAMGAAVAPRWHKPAPAPLAALLPPAPAVAAPTATAVEPAPEAPGPAAPPPSTAAPSSRPTTSAAPRAPAPRAPSPPGPSTGFDLKSRR